MERPSSSSVAAETVLTTLDADAGAALSLDSNQVQAALALVGQRMTKADQTQLDTLVAALEAGRISVEAAREDLLTASDSLLDLIDQYLVGSGSGSGSTDDTTITVQPGWVFPVQGWHSYVDSFGEPRSGGRTHKGTDIFCAKDTPVVAVVDGVILSTNPTDTGLGGIWVKIRGDDGNVYYYAHLSAIREGVSAGLRVVAGEVVGYAGNTGNAAGGPVHLHFEIRPGGGESVDPYPILRAHELMLDPGLLVYLPAPTSTTSTTTTTDTSTTSTSLAEGNTGTGTTDTTEPGTTETTLEDEVGGDDTTSTDSTDSTATTEVGGNGTETTTAVGAQALPQTNAVTLAPSTSG
jgi:murein DD-endopeptidase MepM/ murein hydrolase activator NlpD